MRGSIFLCVCFVSVCVCFVSVCVCVFCVCGCVFFKLMKGEDPPTTKSVRSSARELNAIEMVQWRFAGGPMMAQH